MNLDHPFYDGRPRWSRDDRQRFADGDVLKASTVPGKRVEGPDASEWDDLFDDDEPLACGIENPDYCDTCQ